MTVRFDTETIRLITLFENITNVSIKDCINDYQTNTVYFVVEDGKVGIAIGKNGSSVKNAERVIGKNIKLFEFSKELKIFVRNLIPQTTEVKIRNEDEKIIVEVKVEKKDKALVIGRDGKNINLFKDLLKRNHNVDTIIIR